MLDVYSPPLKITHPLGSWVFTAVLAVAASFYFILTGANLQTTPQGILISFDEIFWIGISTYFMGTFGFIYLKMAPRFKRLPAGSGNIAQLSDFIATYPSIAEELSLQRYVSESASYGDLLQIRKKANRKVLQVASKMLFRRSKQ